MTARRRATVLLVLTVLVGAGLVLATAGPTAARGHLRPAAGVWPLPETPEGTVLREFDPPHEPWLAGHRGIDLPGSAGAVVLAPATGEVTFGAVLAGRPVLVITLRDRLRTTLEPVTAHVSVGDQVHAGDVVGVLAPGAHCGWLDCLHWGLRDGDTYLDPRTLLALAAPVLLPLADPPGPAVRTRWEPGLRRYVPTGELGRTAAPPGPVQGGGQALRQALPVGLLRAGP